MAADSWHRLIFIPKRQMLDRFMSDCLLMRLPTALIKTRGRAIRRLELPFRQPRNIPIAVNTTAVDTLGAHHRVVDNDTAGLGTDVGVAILTTTSHARRSVAFAISGDTIAGGSLGC